jgi:DNA-binding transcriptional ArsR family regulator
LTLLAGQTITAGAIADHFDGARSTISKHIQILTEYGLVESNQRGREIYYQIKMDKMKDIDLWLDQLLQILEARFDNLDNYLTKIQNDRKHGKNRKS